MSPDQLLKRAQSIAGDMLDAQVLVDQALRNGLVIETSSNLLADLALHNAMVQVMISPTISKLQQAEDAPALNTGAFVASDQIFMRSTTMQDQFNDLWDGTFNRLSNVRKSKEKLCPLQLEAGTKVEMEHTKDPAKALKIAKDHLREIPDYYTRLVKMEKQAGEDPLKVKKDEDQLNRTAQLAYHKRQYAKTGKPEHKEMIERLKSTIKRDNRLKGVQQRLPKTNKDFALPRHMSLDKEDYFIQAIGPVLAGAGRAVLAGLRTAGVAAGRAVAAGAKVAGEAAGAGARAAGSAASGAGKTAATAGESALSGALRGAAGATQGGFSGMAGGAARGATSGYLSKVLPARTGAAGVVQRMAVKHAEGKAEEKGKQLGAAIKQKVLGKTADYDEALQQLQGAVGFHKNQLALAMKRSDEGEVKKQTMQIRKYKTALKHVATDYSLGKAAAGYLEKKISGKSPKQRPSKADIAASKAGDFDKPKKSDRKRTEAGVPEVFKGNHNEQSLDEATVNLLIPGNEHINKGGVQWFNDEWELAKSQYDGANVPIWDRYDRQSQEDVFETQASINAAAIKHAKLMKAYMQSLPKTDDIVLDNIDRLGIKGLSKSAASDLDRAWDGDEDATQEQLYGSTIAKQKKSKRQSAGMGRSMGTKAAVMKTPKAQGVQKPQNPSHLMTPKQTMGKVKKNAGLPPTLKSAAHVRDADIINNFDAASAGIKGLVKIGNSIEANKFDPAATNNVVLW